MPIHPATKIFRRRNAMRSSGKCVRLRKSHGFAMGKSLLPPDAPGLKSSSVSIQCAQIMEPMCHSPRYAIPRTIKAWQYFYPVNGSAAAFSPDSTIWLDKPAKVVFAESIPLGNGRLGAMDFGGIVKTKRIALNEDSLVVRLGAEC